MEAFERGRKEYDEKSDVSVLMTAREGLVLPKSGDVSELGCGVRV